MIFLNLLTACKKSLDSLPFYVHDDLYYCVQHYQELYGVNCFVCKKFVEGEVITAMGNTYHADCFVCSQCRSVMEAVIFLLHMNVFVGENL